MLISTLLRWDVPTIGSAAGRFAAIAQDLWATQGRLGGPIGTAVFVEASWEGAASNAAALTLQERSASLTILTNALDGAQLAVGAFATAIDGAQSEVRAGLAAASGIFLVDDYGHLSLIPQPPAPPASGPSSTPMPTPTPTPGGSSQPTPAPMPTPSPSPGPADALASQLGAISGRIATALGAADSADQTCANALHDLQETVDRYMRLHAGSSLRTAETLSMPPLQLLQWLMTVPAAGTSADDVATWWAAQTNDERAALLAAHPDEIGNLDGLPPTTRDQANRLSLAQHIAQLQQQIADPTNAQFNAGGYLSDQLQWYQTVQAQLGKHAQSIDPRTGRAVQVQLLMLDQSAFNGKGRAAMAFGDVGTASNVTYVVPGLNQKVDPEFGRTASNAWNLFTRTGALDHGTTSAVVAWLGYETPGFTNVAWDNCAEHGAQRLRDELNGLHVARGDSQPHLTVVGHSYGSTTVAMAAHRYNLGVDDLVLVGSPGATVQTASQLNVPAGHVWDGAASGDMVTWTRWFGNVDPSTSDFGAHRFEAETVTRSGDGTRNTGEHSHYFDPDSESLNNISQVVLGKDQNVIPAQYRQNDLVVAAYDSYAVIYGAESDPEVNRPVTTFR